MKILNGSDKSTNTGGSDVSDSQMQTRAQTRTKFTSYKQRFEQNTVVHFRFPYASKMCSNNYCFFSPILLEEAFRGFEQ